MKKIVIPYRAFFPNEEPKPLISIQLDGYGEIHALLDSGADTTSLPLAFAKQARIDYEKGIPRMSECAHGDTSEGWEVSCLIEFNGESLQVPICFSEDMGNPPLIGRKGFFEVFRVTFDEKRREITLERNG